MAPLTLVIGNKNYSSWSLRAWLLMKHVGVEFDEILIALDTATTHEQIERYGPSGRVPVLLHGELRVWDSLAICEYVAELDRKSTRLNSSHSQISYAVFCLKKKNNHGRDVDRTFAHVVEHL